MTGASVKSAPAGSDRGVLVHFHADDFHGQDHQVGQFHAQAWLCGIACQDAAGLKRSLDRVRRLKLLREDLLAGMQRIPIYANLESVEVARIFNPQRSFQFGGLGSKLFLQFLQVSRLGNACQFADIRRANLRIIEEAASGNEVVGYGCTLLTASLEGLVIECHRLQ